jgi:glycerophosphoryl diester phosphodiesterase
VNPLLDPDARLVIGHRGARLDAPENTLPAFRLALAQGADALELDVRVTADGVPVVLHDATLDRTTDLRGPVARLPWDAVRSADGGARYSPDGGRTFPWAGRDASVPSLAQVLETFPHTPLLVELKEPPAGPAIRAVVRDHDAAGRVAVAAFDAATLRDLQGTEITVGASRRDTIRLFLAGSLGLLPGGHPRFYAVPDRYHGVAVPTPRVLAAARRLGHPVHVWTVNDPERARMLWQRGVCGIITDRPATMHAQRRQRSAS